MFDSDEELEEFLTVRVPETPSALVTAL